MTTVEEFAPAKINLTLHVTGRRPDGYHLLDSLVVFADVGDRIIARPAERLSLDVTGPRAGGVPTGGSNLVLKAAALMAGPGAAITLDKQLPAASGIGGGSADAAATLRALSRLWEKPVPEVESALSLGADVPVCLRSRAVRMSGIGDKLCPAPSLPPLPAVLVNPGVAVSTPSVFRALERRDKPPMPEKLPDLENVAEAVAWIATQRNDMEPAACALAPVISQALAALGSQDGCLLARMSGSGATCFGVFPDEAIAAGAATTLSRDFPEWWVAATKLEKSSSPEA